MEALEAFLDEAGVGYGRVTLTPIGDGHSNLTYALRRGAEPSSCGDRRTARYRRRRTTSCARRGCWRRSDPRRSRSPKYWRSATAMT